MRTVTVPKLSGRLRKYVRATHIAFSVGWLGLVVAMLTLGITAATASDPAFSVACYMMMGRIGTPVISVDKPWGKTALGRRAAPGRRRSRLRQPRPHSPA